MFRCRSRFDISLCFVNISSHSIIIIVVSGYCFSSVCSCVLRLLNSIHDEIGNRSFAFWFSIDFSLEIAVQTNRPKGMYKGNRRERGLPFVRAPKTYAYN